LLKNGFSLLFSLFGDEDFLLFYRNNSQPIKIRDDFLIGVNLPHAVGAHEVERDPHRKSNGSMKKFVHSISRGSQE